MPLFGARKDRPSAATALAEPPVAAQVDHDVVSDIDIPLHADYSTEDLLRAMYQYGASDLHISVGLPPMLRIHGDLHCVRVHGISPEHADAILLPLINEEQAARYRASGNLDFGFEVPGMARFRANYFHQYWGMAAAFRIIPSHIPTIDQTGLPGVLKKLAELRNGLVIVTGATGSGKSTTLAAILNEINHTREGHMITIEDPIEFFHTSHHCLIEHREVGIHATSFADALHASLREAPDIVMVGEMRDQETIYQAIKAAETGVLVFGTLHTSSASKTIDRVIDVFPAKQQGQIRSMLADSLKAVVAQQLIRRADGQGRVAVHEILMYTTGLANLIRKGDMAQVLTLMQQGRAEGMQTLDGTLRQLMNDGAISRQSAMERAQDPQNLYGAL